MSSAKQMMYHSTMEGSVYKPALLRRDFVNFTLKARFVIEIITQIQRPAQHLVPCHGVLEQRWNQASKPLLN